MSTFDDPFVVCWSCGRQVADTKAICPDCGTRLQADASKRHRAGMKGRLSRLFGNARLTALMMGLHVPTIVLLR